MTNNEYAELALRTAPRPESILFTTAQKIFALVGMGLGGEAGEVVDLLKKIVFHEHPLDGEARARLIKEMGDVEWYLNLLRETINTTLEEVHETNIAKLAARYPEGYFSSTRSQHRKVGDE